MDIDRGLVIREPWLSHILSGRKCWEMRTTPTSFRGWIGLIRQGSGQVVGVARITDSLGPLTRGDYMNYQHRHAIPPEMLEEVLAKNWVHAWVLTDAGALPSPISYAHASGATISVSLDPAARRALAATMPITAALPLAYPTAKPAIDARSASQRNPTGDEVRPTFVFHPEKASARGRPVEDGGFEVLAGSTAMRHGSPIVKRDRFERDRLVREGILVPHADPELYVFAQDHVFSSPSKAAGIIKDGNASGPGRWIDPTTQKSLRHFLAREDT